MKFLLAWVEEAVVDAKWSLITTSANAVNGAVQRAYRTSVSCIKDID